MKQIIPFIKDIKLGSKISEITSIALEHNLKMENNDSIVGIFTISGKYKINDVSINEEEFENEINFDITLDDKYDALKVQIDIDDFYYEIINDEYLRVHIHVLVDNLVYVKEKIELEEQKEDIRCIEDEIDIKKITNMEVKKDMQIKEESIKKEEIKEEVNVTENKEENILNENLTSSFLSEEENYTTYKVHIVRESETIEMIEEKYNVSKEILMEYNLLDNIMIGSKIIIPINNE